MVLQFLLNLGEIMRFLLVCFFVVYAAAGAFGQDAAAIVAGARDRIGAKTIVTRSRMELKSKNGAASERAIDQFYREGADGESGTVVVFQKPASVAGTRFLSLSHKDGESDKWIFLPSFGRVRRISASEGSGSFVGTDLSYDDISSADRDTALDTHSIVREDTFNGKAVYVIQSIPKRGDYQYSKMIQWIGKADKITYKLELYNKRGVLQKVLEVLTVRNVQGYDTTVASRMSNVINGTSTTINVDVIKYDEAIPDSVFTQAYLESGRF